MVPESSRASRSCGLFLLAVKLSKFEWAASAIGEEKWCDTEFHAGGEVARKPKFWALVRFAVGVISRSWPK